jgi:hypothetical protein
MGQLQPVSKNRRVSIRRKPRGARVSCRKGAFGVGPDLTLKVLDLSETGVRLLVKTALGERQEVELGLLGLGHQRPLKLIGDVVWCVEAGDGGHCVGVRFQRRLPYGDFQCLV